MYFRIVNCVADPDVLFIMSYPGVCPLHSLYIVTAAGQDPGRTEYSLLCVMDMMFDVNRHPGWYTHGNLQSF